MSKDDFVATLGELGKIKTFVVIYVIIDYIWYKIYSSAIIFNCHGYARHVSEGLLNFIFTKVELRRFTHNEKMLSFYYEFNELII